MEKIIARSSHRHRLVAATIAALVLVTAIFMSTYRVNADSHTTPASNEHIISVHDNGVDKGFITKQSTLRDALDEQHISINKGDLVEPGLDSQLVANSYQVNIYRARPVAIRDGVVLTKVVTAYRSPAQIAAQAHITLHDEDIAEVKPSVDPLADGAAEIMTIQRATAFTFNFYGKTEVDYTQGDTVGDMLKEKNITMSDKDGVKPGLSTPIVAGMTISLWREGVQTQTREEPAHFTTKTIQDADQPVGYRKVKQAGVNGLQLVTYTVKVRNGKEISRQKINSVVTEKPTQEVIIVGVQLPSGSHSDWMAAAGISPRDYGFVNFIVNHENRSWHPCRVQGVGTAIDCQYRGNMGYGLVQATPGRKMASAGADWATNPVTQLRWANSYAVGRYGSWQNAYTFWINNNHW